MSSPNGNTGYKRKGSDLLRTFRKMQNERYKIFQQQNLENGRFDVTFEIEGQQLHAHKFIIASVSEPMDSWLSDRWTTKNEVVNIEAYSYDEFYEFLTFLYSSECKLSEENIVKMTDMAEFYGVQCLKEFCDEFLTNMKKSVETIEELFDFAQKYSLPKLKDSIKSFFWEHYEIVCKSDAFIDFTKPFVEFFLNDDIYMYNLRADVTTYGCKSEILFESIYKWAEHRVLKDQVVGGDENFNLHKAVKAELSTFLPKFKFSEMDFDFLKDFLTERGFLLSATKVFHRFLFRNSKDRFDVEAAFKKTYELAEKQALKKQEMYPRMNFILHDAVNTFLVYVIPEIKFSSMSFSSLHFSVEKGYFLSPAELAEVYSSCKDRRIHIRESSFKETYELAEEQALKKQEMFPEDNFILRDTVNAYLIDVMPNVKFSTMSVDFLTNFVLEKGFLLSPADVYHFFLSRNADKSDSESSFKETVELAEKVALKKQEMFPEDDFNLANSVKDYLIDVLPNVDFSKMDNSFLTDFMVSNGIISEEQANQLFETEVEIINNGKSITGTFKDVLRIRLFIEKKKFNYGIRQSITKIRFSNLKMKIPKIPSTVEKMEGCGWYLCLDAFGFLTFKHHSFVQQDDYLIAQMKSFEDFQLVPGETTFLTVRLKKV